MLDQIMKIKWIVDIFFYEENFFRKKIDLNISS